MDLRDARESDLPAVVEMCTTRCPHVEPWIVTSIFGDGADYDATLVATDGDRLVGLGFSMHLRGTPDEQRQILVIVEREAGGRGVGHDLYVACRAAQPAVVKDLRTRVFDDDPEAMAVARHWGFEPAQLSITSRLDLAGVTAPDPPTGVTLEAADDLVFEDAADGHAFDAMFTASQTNPEAANNHVTTREEMAAWVFPGERGVGSLARVDGVPAAIAFAIVSEPAGVGGVGYTGVDPQFRGRGLGRLVKQHVHHRAAALGIRSLGTDNEENNRGIRRLNAELGYVPAYGVLRMVKRL
jgi:GNAT superfamily N-acetyltransferase